jgi:hypothetical protein
MRLPNENILALRRADQARTDFALLESSLEIIMHQLAQLPTRGQLAQAALGIFFCSAVLTTGHRRGHPGARGELAVGERIPLTGGDAGIPTRASLPFHRAHKRRLSRISEESCCPARLRRTGRRFKHPVADDPRCAS